METKLASDNSPHSRLLLLTLVPLLYLAWFIMFFSPVLFGDKLFPSDGQFAAFFTSIRLWNPLPLAGMPGLAEPHLQQLYPLRWVFAALPREIGFNLFMVSSYVLASSFAFGYAYAVTRSILAATVGGIAFGMSGYMIAHLGHTGLVPAAAWLPLIIWSLEELRRKVSVGWLVTATLSIAMVILAGHPQAFVYSIYLAFAYAICFGSASSVGWLRYVGMYLLLVCAGAALAAPQILPMLELGDLSVRSELTFEAFKEYSLPLTHLALLVSPYLFGGAYLPGFPKYFGAYNLAEMTGYVGLLTLILAATGSWYRWRDRLGAFWLGVAAVSLLLALGDATPLLRATYELPVINKLRAPARHFHEMTFAASVLAALGLHALQNARDARKIASRAVVSGAVLLIVVVALSVAFYDRIQLKSVQRGAGVLGPVYLALTFLTPLAVFALSASALLYWLKSIHSWIRQVVVVAVLAIDLGSFGLIAEWRWGPPSAVLAMPSFAAKYVSDLDQHHQRLMTMVGWTEPVLPFSPMMSQFYGIPSVGGYGPLLTKRYADLSLVTQGGWISPNVLLPDNRAPDLLAARYIVVPRSRPGDSVAVSGQWSKQDFLVPIGLGTGCLTSNPTQARFVFPTAVNIDEIGIVSRLACSTTLEQGQEVARLSLIDANGRRQTQSLRAGYDTAEWAIDCADVAASVKHAKATVFDSWENKRAGFPTCQGHRFVSKTSFELGSYRELVIDWMAKPPSVMLISKITVSDHRDGQFYAVRDDDYLFANTARFEHVEDFKESSVYRNLRAMPRAWLVGQVVSATREQVLKSIHTSVMPDGTPFDPYRVAFVEDAFRLDSKEQGIERSAVVAELSNERVVITTNSREPSFLVLSDVFYPGWKASIDGQETKIYLADYALRGVAVPAGGHTVVFSYEPRSVRDGMLIFALALLSLAGLVVYFRGTRPATANLRI